MPLVALAVIGAIGTTAGVIGQIKAGNAAKRASEAGARASESSAQLSDYNAGVAELQAADAVARGGLDQSLSRQQTKQVIGSQRAGQAAGNIDVSMGSALDVQGDAVFLGELDAHTIANNAAREAWGYKVEAYNYSKQADIQRKEGGMQLLAGKQAQSASRWQAGGTALTGAYNLAALKYQSTRAKTKAPKTP